MGAALGWGALAASSLVLGVLLAFAWKWPPRLIGLILAFGAGALISAVSFELAEEGVRLGTGESVGIGLAVGALTYYSLLGLISPRSRAGSEGTGLALGSFIGGIPEQFVLGIGLVGGEGVSVALLVAIFVSNLPEGIGSASAMSAGGTPRSRIVQLFIIIAVACALATGVGYGIADSVSGDVQAAINGFAAGALLVMLIDLMIPEASAKAGRPAGLLTVVGFAVAIALSNV